MAILIRFHFLIFFWENFNKINICKIDIVPFLFPEYFLDSFFFEIGEIRHDGCSTMTIGIIINLDNLIWEIRRSGNHLLKKEEKNLNLNLEKL